MPAGLPGDNALNNAGNPNAGVFVIMDPLSGPKGTPLDAKKADYTNGGTYDADPGNISTGALCTGIGFSALPVIEVEPSDPAGTTAAQAIHRAGFIDNQAPGAIEPQYGTQNNGNSAFMYIGGGRMIANTGTLESDRGRPFIPSIYTAGIAICGAGNGGSRDSGANTGFALKMVTATGAVANGAAVEAGFVNRSGVALISGQSVHGSASVALAAAS